MNNTLYQEMPCISSHWLIALLKSPAACWRKYLDPQRIIDEPTDAMRFGTLVHGLALTPQRFEKEFAVMPCERRSKADRARWAWVQAQGWTPIRPAELEKARAVVAALHADRSARKLLHGGKKERMIVQPRSQGLLPLKGRLDVHQETKRQVVELKTTYDLDAVEAAMERYRYPLSAAFYRDIVRGRSAVMIFVQTRPPYPVQIVELTRQQLAEGSDQWRAALRRFDECWRANAWPEAEPAPDDDPLMMPAPFAAKAASGPRFEIPVGELAL